MARTMHDGRTADSPVVAHATDVLEARMSSIAQDRNVDYRLLSDDGDRTASERARGLDGAPSVLIAMLLRIVDTLERVELQMARLIDVHGSPAGSEVYGDTNAASEITRRTPSWVRKHGEQLGGWKSKLGRGGRWTFRLADVEERARALGAHPSPSAPIDPPPPPPDDDMQGLVPRPRT